MMSEDYPPASSTSESSTPESQQPAEPSQPELASVPEFDQDTGSPPASEHKTTYPSDEPPSSASSPFSAAKNASYFSFEAASFADEAIQTLREIDNDQSPIDTMAALL